MTFCPRPSVELHVGHILDMLYLPDSVNIHYKLPWLCARECSCHSQCLIIKSKYTECLINTSQLQYFFLSTFGVTLLGQFPVVGSTRPSCPDWDQMKKSQNKDMSQMFLSHVSPFPMTHRSQENYRSRDVWMEIRPNETKSPPFLTA